MIKKTKAEFCDDNSTQMERLLECLPYILPTRCAEPKDEYIAITARYFKSLYGNWILDILHYIGAMPENAKFIKKPYLNEVIDKVKKYMAVDDGFVWENGATLKVYRSSYKKESSGSKEVDGFNDKCIVGMTWASLLVLFYELLLKVHQFDKDEYFNLNVAKLFNIIESTNQVNMFYRTLRFRRSYVKGSKEAAEKKRASKTDVASIVQNLGIKSVNALSVQTREMVRKEYKRTYHKKLKKSDKSLTNCIIDAAGHSNFS